MLSTIINYHFTFYCTNIITGVQYCKLLFLIQTHWEGKQPAVIKHLFRVPKEVKTYRYHTSITKRPSSWQTSDMIPKSVGAWLETAFMSNSSICLHCSGQGSHTDFNAIPAKADKRMSRLNALAQLHRHTIWESLILSITETSREKCSLALISPFSGNIEWIKISCTERINISNIICLRRITDLSKVFLKKNLKHIFHF